MSINNELTIEKFLELKNDPDNKRVLNIVARKFRHLDRDDIESAKNYSIWKAFLAHTHGKFSTLLSSIMNRQCMMIHKKIKPMRTVQLDIDIPATENKKQDIKLNLKCLSPIEKRVFNLRSKGLSLAKIGEKENRSREGVRQIYLRCVRKLQQSNIEDI